MTPLDVSPWILLGMSAALIVAVYLLAKFVEVATVKELMSDDTVLAQMTDEELDEWIDHR